MDPLRKGPAGMSETRRRHFTASTRYTPEEWERVDAVAKSLGLTVGQYQRAAVLSAQGLPLPKVRRRPPADAAELRQVLAALGKIGSNVNQVAAAVNAGQQVAADELAAALRSVADMRAAVMRAIEGGGS